MGFKKTLDVLKIVKFEVGCSDLTEYVNKKNFKHSFDSLTIERCLNQP